MPHTSGTRRPTGTRGTGRRRPAGGRPRAGTRTGPRGGARGGPTAAQIAAAKARRAATVKARGTRPVGQTSALRRPGRRATGRPVQRTQPVSIRRL